MQVKTPYTLKFLVDAVGDEATFSFIDETAGQRLYIPVKWENSHLAQIYGEGIAKALSEEKGGSSWEVPLYKDWRVRKLKELGHSNNEIAQRLSMHTNHVRQRLSQRQTGINPPKEAPPSFLDLYPQIEMF